MDTIKALIQTIPLYNIKPLWKFETYDGCPPSPCVDVELDSTISIPNLDVCMFLVIQMETQSGMHALPNPMCSFEPLSQ